MFGIIIAAAFASRPMYAQKVGAYMLCSYESGENCERPSRIDNVVTLFVDDWFSALLVLST